MLEAAWQDNILFQCTPGETYESIVAAGRDPNDWRGPNGCGSATISYLFFSIFQILVCQIYLNLVIAIIIDAFTGVSKASQLLVNDALIDDFVRIWSEFDP